MKVVNIQLEGRYAGPHKQMLDLAVEIQKIGVETVLFFPFQDSDAFVHVISKTDVAFVQLKTNRLARSPIDFIKFFLTFNADIKKIMRALLEVKPDIVQCNGSWQIKGVIAARRLSIPIIWHMTDTKMPKLIRKIFNKVKNYAHVNHFIAASNRGMNYYQDKTNPQEVMSVIQSPVDTELFDTNTTKVEKFWSSHQDHFKVITVANISPVKGLERLVEVARLIQLENSLNIQFVVVGRIWESQRAYHGKIVETINKQNIKNVTIIPGASNVSEWLKGADIYFCSSHSESSPIAVWEAMSMSLPVVATNVGDLVELVKQEDAGFVHELDEIDALVDSIIKLKNDSELLTNLKINARQAALKHFSLTNVAEQHKRAYQNLLDDEHIA